MFWIFLAVLVITAGLLVMGRRRRYESVEDEPWRASLAESEEPLDMDEIRRAEDEWLEEAEWEDPSAGGEEWR
jgi:hypothetical protein